MRNAIGESGQRAAIGFISFALLLLFPQIGTAQMPQSLTVATSPGPFAQEVEYRLQIHSGPQGAAFGFQYELPSWPTGEAVVGSPVRVAALELRGPGSIRPAASGPPPLPVLRRRNACVRDLVSPYSQRYWVELPANMDSVVGLRLRGTYPAWPGTKYGLAFSTFTLDDPFAQLAPLATVNVPRFMPKGTRIEIRAKGNPKKGFVPELVGRTLPPFRRGQISLKVVRPARSGSVRLEYWKDPRHVVSSLGAVRTDQSGHFRVAPRLFAGKGPYAVLARSEARGGRAADWNCGAFFSID